MNGFISTVLNLTLSWIRALISNLWGLMTSGSGGHFYRFLADYWLYIALFVCLACTLVDLLVYFFRWRPDYVWRSRMHRTREKRPQPPKPEKTPVVYDEAPPQPVPMPAYAAPLEEVDMLWDADVPMQADWEAPPDAQPLPQPDPVVSYQDVQAGFAPPVPPEKLYVPSASYRAPLHPGLNQDAFRQSFGLQTDEESRQERTVLHAPAFRPFTVREEEPVKTASALSRFAKRARTFVGVDEVEDLSIHDLQSTVDVSQAFHAPVYPQPMDHKEG